MPVRDIPGQVRSMSAVIRGSHLSSSSETKLSLTHIYIIRICIQKASICVWREWMTSPEIFGSAVCVGIALWCREIRVLLIFVCFSSFLIRESSCFINVHPSAGAWGHNSIFSELLFLFSCARLKSSGDFCSGRPQTLE